jgi:ParB/RepB/Spo0J family partition protein
MVEIVNRPVSFFRPDPNQPRKNFPEPELRALGESMKAVGQLVPGQARPDGLIIDMERRWRAAQLVGITHLDAILTDRLLDPAEVILVQLATAVHRQALTSPELTNAIARAAETILQKDLAKKLVLDEGLVSAHLTIARKGTPSLLDSYRSGRTPFTTAAFIARQPADQQPALVIEVESGSTREAIKRKQRTPSDGAKVNRLVLTLAPGYTVTFARKGLTLADAREGTAQAAKVIARAINEHYSISTLGKMTAEAAKSGEKEAVTQ